MTVVVFSRLELISLKENTKAVVTALKRKNEIFRNVRLNLVTWDGGSSFSNEIVPLAFLQTGSCFGEVFGESDGSLSGQDRAEIRLASLFSYLKKFHARSKVILVFAPEAYGEAYGLGDKAVAKEALNPFLKQKILLLAGDEPVTGTKLFMDCYPCNTSPI